ncbi:16523_t:CDS:1, partial [Acaulospora colombiana]
FSNLYKNEQSCTLSCNNSFKEEADPTNNGTDIAATREMEKELQTQSYTTRMTMNLMDSNIKIRLKNKNETSQEEAARDVNEWHKDWTLHQTKGKSRRE